MIQRLLFFPIAALTSMLLMSACSDGPSTVNDEPPQLPPAASMEIDFSSLIGGQQSSSTAGRAIDNYIQAIYRAGSLENLIDRNLSQPRRLLAAAHDASAELNADQQWQWEYETAIDSVSFGNRAVAERITASVVNWSFFVTSERINAENRLYFSGTSTGNGQEGSWTIHRLSNAAEGDPAARVDWQAGESDNMSLQLQILTNEHGSVGDSLSYSTDGPNKTVAYYDASSGRSVTTQWDTTSQAGYIIAPGVNNGERACWDENLQNVSCGE